MIYVCRECQYPCEIDNHMGSDWHRPRDGICLFSENNSPVWRNAKD